MNSDLLYCLEGIGKEYSGPSERLVILDDVNLEIAQGESLAVMGASGSGKTTLLHILGTLDTPSRGSIRFHGADLAGLSVQERARLRNEEIGFVFQFHHLLPEFDTLENVAMPAMLAGTDRSSALELAREALDQVGLSQRADHMVTTLSGGERQRAAIARAVLRKPKVLLADEPTGNLDEQTGELVSDVLVRLNRETGMTLVVVTHNPELARRMSRRMELHSGVLYATT